MIFYEILCIIGVFGILGGLIFGLMWFITEQEISKVSILILLISVVSIFTMYKYQYVIAEKHNNYTEETYYVEAYYNNTIMTNRGEFEMIDTNIINEDEGEFEYLGIDDFSDLKQGDVIKIYMLDGITHSKLLKVEFIGNALNEQNINSQ